MSWYNPFGIFGNDSEELDTVNTRQSEPIVPEKQTENPPVDRFTSIEGWKYNLTNPIETGFFIVGTTVREGTKFIGSAVGTGVGGFVEGVSGKPAGEVAEDLRNIGSNVTDSVSNAVENVGDKISNTFGNFGDSIKNMFKSLKGGILWLLIGGLVIFIVVISAISWGQKKVGIK